MCIIGNTSTGSYICKYHYYFANCNFNFEWDDCLVQFEVSNCKMVCRWEFMILCIVLSMCYDPLSSFPSPTACYQSLLDCLIPLSFLSSLSPYDPMDCCTISQWVSYLLINILSLILYDVIDPQSSRLVVVEVSLHLHTLIYLELNSSI